MNFTDRFLGFQKTAKLWDFNAIETLPQFPIPFVDLNYIPETNHKKLRLGKWIEIFTAFQLQQIEGIKIIAENLQIKNNKQTIGEIDVLLLQQEQSIHLEIAYKFYLYDDTMEYDHHLDYWIGPNRTDSLTLKLKKLTNKQLPLLLQPETQPALNRLGLNSNDIKQFVNFKAQLFVPYHKRTIDFKALNKDCTQGFYIHFNQIEILKNYHFYIPIKLDWLVEPQLNVKWLNFNDTVIAIRMFMDKKQSPLCWLKDENNQLTKCFVTWW